MHVNCCAECRNEQDQLRESIGLFRTATTGWSVHHDLGIQRGFIAEPACLHRPAPNSRWFIAGAFAVFTFVCGFVFRNDPSTDWQSPIETGVATSADRSSQAEIDKDNEFLSHLNNALSENVPASMQPLQISIASEVSSH